MNKINTKNNRKIKYLIMLIFCFLGLPIYKALAALEVQYPTISNQTIGASSKIPEVALYIFNASLSIGYVCVFISLAIAGVMWVLSPVSPNMRTEAKEWVSSALSGLLLLVLTYLIVTTINPAFKTFSDLTALPKVEIKTPVAKEPAGVYFKGSDGKEKYYSSSIPDLVELKNKVSSIRVVSDSYNYYVSILYDKTNFFGKCEIITTSGGGSWANSASVHRIKESPSGDGVYFYRKAFFDEKGGYYKVDNSEIYSNGSAYVKYLEDLKFQEVPEEEQICKKYDKNEKCVEREPPTLGGDRISSVKISGDYIVLFVYLETTDNPSGPWTFCQEFPISDDINKTGPQQVKWQGIRNNGGLVPNWVVIMPI